MSIDPNSRGAQASAVARRMSKRELRVAYIHHTGRIEDLQAALDGAESDYDTLAGDLERSERSCSAWRANADRRAAEVSDLQQQLAAERQRVVDLSRQLIEQARLAEAVEDLTAATRGELARTHDELQTALAALRNVTSAQRPS